MNPPKRVLITGAGSGLGQALAHRFAAAGAQVACVDIQAERAEATLATLTGSGHAVFVADVSDDASMQAMADAVLADWGAPDVLINNAGIASGGDVLEAMKMHYEIVADAAGMVSEIMVVAGQQVAADDVLMQIEVAQ